MAPHVGERKRKEGRVRWAGEVERGMGRQASVALWPVVEVKRERKKERGVDDRVPPIGAVMRRDMEERRDDAV